MNRRAQASVFLRDQWPRLIVGASLLVLFFGNSGFRSLIGNWLELHRLRGQIDTLNQEEATLQEKLKSLRSGPAPVEGLARRELGYIKKGEIEYRFPPPVKREDR